MNKQIFYIALLAILLSGLVCAQGTKVAPLNSKLTISGLETNCTTIYVLPDKNISIEHRWSEVKSDSPDSYDLSAKRVGVEVNYTRIKNGEYRFCFNATKNGYFYGVLFFQQKDSLIKIGSLVELDVINQKTTERIYLFTSNVIKGVDGTNIWLGFIFILLLIILIIVIKKYSY